MSGPAQSAVLLHSKQTDLNLYKLLQYIAHGAGNDGINRAAPRQETLAAAFSTTDRTIRRWLDKLEQSGELVTLRKGGGKGRPSQYKINLPIPATKASSQPEETAVSPSRSLEKTVDDLAQQVASLQTQLSTIAAQLADKADKNTANRPPMPEITGADLVDENAPFCPPIEQMVDKVDNSNRTRWTGKADTNPLKPTDDPLDPKDLSIQGEERTPPQTAVVTQPVPNTYQNRLWNLALDHSDGNEAHAAVVYRAFGLFLEKSQLPTPYINGSNHGDIFKKWFDPLSDMLAAADHDLEIFGNTITAVSKIADGPDGFTVVQPKSFQNSFNGLLAKQKRASNDTNGYGGLVPDADGIL